jgi:hypothetical protein
MAYDFFVFPAEEAADLAAATELYETAPERGRLTSDGRVAAFVAALDGASSVGSPGGFLTAPPRAHDRAAHVATSWDDPMGNLHTVAGLARAHDLSVLDVQLDALYDPRDGLDVALDTEGGPRLPFLTRRILSCVMTHIGELRYQRVNVSRAPGVFAQAYRDDDGSWAVEHREDGQRHFAARTTDPVLVEQVLWSWARDDNRWQARLAFAPVEM